MTFYPGRHYNREVDGAAVTVKKFYTLGSTTVAVRTVQGSNDTLNWILGDHLGSASVTANADGTWNSEIKYTAFGEVRASYGLTPTDYRYTGQLEQAELGLIYFVARFYDPSIMMFNQPDTQIPEPYNPLDWNRYSYTRYNPLSYTDPDGHWVIPAAVIVFVKVASTVIDWGWTAYDTYNYATVALDSTNPPQARKDALANAVAAVGMEFIEPDESLSPVALPIDDIVRHSDDLLDVPRSAESTSTLFHYTNEKGLNGILNSNELLPSLKSINPRDVRYGEGQYLSDIVPGSMTPNQISRQLVGNPFQGDKFTHYVGINIEGLNVMKGRPGVYLVPNTKPLDLWNRIISWVLC